MMYEEFHGPYFSTDLIGADGRLKRLHKGKDNFLSSAFRGGRDAGHGDRQRNDGGPAGGAGGRRDGRVSGDRVGAVIGNRDGKDARNAASLAPKKSLLAGNYDQPGTRNLL